jgi:hypothetical protein
MSVERADLGHASVLVRFHLKVQDQKALMYFSITDHLNLDPQKGASLTMSGPETVN